MRTGSSRSIIAVVAAYAIVLQALLSGWAVVTHAAVAASFGVMCTHDAAAGTPGGSHAPMRDDDCPCGPLCAMAGHALVFAVFDRPGGAVVWMAGKGEVVASIDYAAAAIPDPEATAHLPRAPPTA